MEITSCGINSTQEKKIHVSLCRKVAVRSKSHFRCKPCQNQRTIVGPVVRNPFSSWRLLRKGYRSFLALAFWFAFERLKAIEMTSSLVHGTESACMLANRMRHEKSMQWQWKHLRFFCCNFPPQEWKRSQFCVRTDWSYHQIDVSISSDLTHVLQIFHTIGWLLLTSQRGSSEISINYGGILLLCTLKPWRHRIRSLHVVFSDSSIFSAHSLTTASLSHFPLIWFRSGSRKMSWT